MRLGTEEKVFFDYEITRDFIAQVPADKRESSRLMVVDRGTGTIEDGLFSGFRSCLNKGDVLVLNDTRVVPARVPARKSATGGKVEILFLEWCGKEWRGLVKGSVRDGMTLSVNGWPQDLKVLDNKNGMVRIEPPDCVRPLDFFNKVGKTPLPPYIHRISDNSRDDIDKERYQTVYASEDGSVAAPTAGLHFNDRILEEIQEKGIELVRVTLHVGWGTFMPVRGDYKDHRLHPEWGRISGQAAKVLNRALKEKRRVIAVGTTTARLLESGWSPSALSVVPVEGPVSLYITPGYRFRVVGAMLTNFHRPRSTLLLLVDALAGSGLIERAYEEAIRMNYRFFSYGDAMFIK